MGALGDIIFAWAHRMEIWPLGILIHALELKLWPFEVFPYVYIGKPCICNFFSAHTLGDKWGIPVRHMYILHWQPLPDLLKIGVQVACLHCMALLYIQLDHVEVSGQFFLLSVWSPWISIKTIKYWSKSRGGSNKKHQNNSSDGKLILGDIRTSHLCLNDDVP